MDKDQNEPWLPPGNGWIEWRGVENPVPGAVVDYLTYRERHTSEHYPMLMKSEDINWVRSHYTSDIVAYRVVTPAPTAFSPGTVNPGSEGISLRDYAAIHADLARTEFHNIESAADFVGEAVPLATDMEGMLRLSARAGAKIRYIYADAMLAAREASK